MFVLSIINSIVGKTGNIGYRFSYVQKKLDKNNIDNYTIARGCVSNSKYMYTCGALSYLQRFLQYVRRNYIKEFNSRWIDLKIFEVFFYLIFYVFIKSKIHSDAKVAYLVETSPFIIKILKRNNFKIVLDLPILPSSYVIKMLRNNPDCGLVYNKYLDKVERECFNLADIIVVPSSFVAKELTDSGVPKDIIEIIPFGVDIDNRLVVNKKNENSNGLDFVFAGNVSNRKGIKYLLDAWNSKDFTEDRLHLCGKVNRNIRAYLEEINLSNVILPGFVNTFEYFSDCDIYIFPSLMEGSSKSIYEAMACGLPCIVTPQSGSVIIDSVDGFVIDAFSSESIKEALLKMKSSNFAEMGRLARLNVQQFSWDKYSLNLIHVLLKNE